MDKGVFKTSDFDYDLPEGLVAAFPPEKRGDSRMLVLDRNTGESEIRAFRDITDYLSPGDVMVLNDTKVIKARFLGRKKETGGEVELLLLTPLDDARSEWKAMARPARRLNPGTVIELVPSGFAEGAPPRADVEVLAKNPDGTVAVRFANSDFERDSKFFGHTPLPPYIKRSDTPLDAERYQTVYAEKPGAVAAPTAGLHFTERVLAEIAAKGVEMATVTLHVGPGTFRPVKSENPDDHKMHSEIRIVSEESADIINSAKSAGRRVVAVGTTVVRALESSAVPDGKVIPSVGETDIFLRPPMKPKVPDMLLTNFHLPKSTLLMLVATFAPLDFVLDAYKKAVANGVRFHSYGDCMLIGSFK